jgi:hypothetical protein
VVLRTMSIVAGLLGVLGCDSGGERPGLAASREELAAVRRGLARLAQIQAVDATLALASETLRDAISEVESSTLAPPGRSSELRRLERRSVGIRGRLILARAAPSPEEGRKALRDVIDEMDGFAVSLGGHRDDLDKLGRALKESASTLRKMSSDFGELQQQP